MLLGAEGKRNGLASAMGIEFAYVRADLDFDGQLFNDVAVRYKGNVTFLHLRGTLKRSLKIDLNEHVKGQKLAGVSTLNLHSNVTDASWMNEVLSHRLYREAGVAAPRTATPGFVSPCPAKHDKEYLGLYSLVEMLGKASRRKIRKPGKGAIFKPVTPNAVLLTLATTGAKYNQTYDPKTMISVEGRGATGDRVRQARDASGRRGLRFAAP